jgi:hypothetical protein
MKLISLIGKLSRRDDVKQETLGLHESPTATLNGVLTLTFGAGYLTLHFISRSLLEYRLIVVNVELEYSISWRLYNFNSRWKRMLLLDLYTFIFISYKVTFSMQCI